MTISALCPCCSDKLIHHISYDRDYWFCRGCWQEMPVIASNVITQKSNSVNGYQKSQFKSFNKIKQIKQAKLSVT